MLMYSLSVSLVPWGSEGFEVLAVEGPDVFYVDPQLFQSVRVFGELSRKTVMDIRLPSQIWC